MSEDEMLQKASDVAVGEVIQVRSVKATTRQGIEYKEMEATFRVTSPTKGAAKVNELWILRYQIVDSPRYAGDKVPQFEKGDKLAVYGRRTQKNDEGKLLVFLTSSNDIRLQEAAPSDE